MTIRSTDHPLFSCITTLYTLILLYFPSSLRASLSPVLILTFLLLLFLLRLGSSQKLQLQPPPNIINDNNPRTEQEEEEKEGEVSGNINENGQSQTSASFYQQVDQWVVGCQEGHDQDHGFGSSFIGWDVGAPLEVIHEAPREGGESEEEEDDPGRVEFPGLERYPSLCMYYPETDSDSSSVEGDGTVAGWVSSEEDCLRWEEEDREGSLIEIALNGREKNDSGPGSSLGLDYNIDEENLIEIDISPEKNDGVGS